MSLNNNEHKLAMTGDQEIQARRREQCRQTAAAVDCTVGVLTGPISVFSSSRAGQSTSR